jgi:hypothetical protein
MSEKPTNPKDALGIRKAPLSTVSMPVLMELGVAMMEGAKKYGRFNYRVIGVRYSVYFDACLRHLSLWWEGENIDAESGMPHVIKAMACLMILEDAKIHNKFVDDRPPKTEADWLLTINKKTEELIDKFPNSIEPYTELNKNDNRE